MERLAPLRSLMGGSSPELVAEAILALLDPHNEHPIKRVQLHLVTMVSVFLEWEFHGVIPVRQHIQQRMSPHGFCMLSRLALAEITWLMYESIRHVDPETQLVYDMVQRLKIVTISYGNQKPKVSSMFTPHVPFPLLSIAFSRL